MKNRKTKTIIGFALLIVALLVTCLYAMATGSLRLGLGQVLRGLFAAYDKQVATVYDLRFPRIVIAMLAGAALSVSGALLQAVLKKPLADPGIIGISGGAGLFGDLLTALFPTLFFWSPLFSCIGGMAGFLLVYALSGSNGHQPTRMILVGIAVAALFSGLTEGLGYWKTFISGGSISTNLANMAMKTWSDVWILVCYVPIGLVLALLASKACNLLALEEKTIRSLGIPLEKLRLCLSMMAVVLASVATAIVGVVSFLALIVPHIGRQLVGNDHRVLLPFTALLGAFVFLVFDTLGRTVMAPVEVPAQLLMAIIGGPLFIWMLRRGGQAV